MQSRKGLSTNRSTKSHTSFASSLKSIDQIDRNQTLLYPKQQIKINSLLRKMSQKLFKSANQQTRYRNMIETLHRHNYLPASFWVVFFHRTQVISSIVTAHGVQLTSEGGNTHSSSRTGHSGHQCPDIVDRVVPLNTVQRRIVVKTS